LLCSLEVQREEVALSNQMQVGGVEVGEGVGLVWVWEWVWVWVWVWVSAGVHVGVYLFIPLPVHAYAHVVAVDRCKSSRRHFPTRRRYPAHMHVYGVVHGCT